MSPGPNIFDRQLLRVRQARAHKLGPATFLLDRTASELGERLSAVLRRFNVAVDLGTPTDAVRHVLAASGKVGTIVAANVHPADHSFLRVAADEEAIPFGNARSIWSIGTRVPIRQRPARNLDTDSPRTEAGWPIVGRADWRGKLVGAPRSIATAEIEIEGGVSPHVAPFADVRELGTLLQRAGFALPVIDSERLVVRYDSVFALVRDLRRMGAQIY